MKNLLLSILLTIISTSAMAEWTFVDASNSTAAYVDIASKRKVGKKVTLWILHDLKSPEKWGENDKYLSAAIKKEYNCADETTKDINITLYTENMQKGETIHSEDIKKVESIAIAPNSINYSIYEIACNIKKQ